MVRVIKTATCAPAGAKEIASTAAATDLEASFADSHLSLPNCQSWAKVLRLELKKNLNLCNSDSYQQLLICMQDPLELFQ